MQGGSSSNSITQGTNHPNGVIFNYYLKDLDEKDKVSLTVMEMDGDTIKTFSNSSTGSAGKLKVKSGGNTHVWNMRYDGFTSFKGMILYSSPNRGPKAVPGKYKAVLSVNGQNTEQEFEIVKDPRLPNTAKDFQDQFDYLISVRDKVSEAHEGIIRIRDTRDELNFLKDKIKGEDGMSDLIDMANELDQKMSVIENNIHMTKNQSYQDPLNYGIRINNRIAFLLADQQRGDYPPTDQAIQFRDEVFKELDKELSDLDKLISESLSSLNAKLKEKGIDFLGK